MAKPKRENVMAQSTKDKIATWIENKHGVKSCVPFHIAQERLRDKNDEYQLCDPEFVPKKRVRPYDDEKNEKGQKRANTKMMGTEVEARLKLGIVKLREIAKEKQVDIKGLKSKKDILEALEAAGILFD